MEEIKLKREKIRHLQNQQVTKVTLSTDETFFSSMVNRVKNNKKTAILLLVGIVLISVLAVVDAPSKLINELAPKYEELSVIVELQRYDRISGPIDQPQILRTLRGDVNDPAGTAKVICREIAEATKSKMNLQAHLEIDGSSLKSSQRIAAALQRSHGPNDVCLERREFGRDDRLDLSSYFTDASDSGSNVGSLARPGDHRGKKNTRTLCLTPRECCFDMESITIYKNDNKFSFESERHKTWRNVKFNQKKVAVLLEPLQGASEGKEFTESTRSAVTIELRKCVKAVDHLELSPLTRDELSKRTLAAKDTAVESGSAPDFIVKTVPIIKTRRYLFWAYPFPSAPSLK